MAAFGDVCSSKPLFMSIYATVATGIIFSSIFIFSALYSSPEKPAGSWFSSSFSKSPRPQQSNSSKPFWPYYLILLQRNKVSIFDCSFAGLDKNNVSLTSLEQDSKFTGGIWEVPAGDKMPDLKEFRLTKEMVEKRTKDNIIIMTFGNFAFMDFILTWVRHLTDLNVFNLLVGKFCVFFFFFFGLTIKNME